MGYQKQNLHAHSTFCDGVHTPEEMVQEALLRGFDSLGFSMHSYNSRSGATFVTPQRVEAYKKEILRLKAHYRGEIDIFLGVEQDALSDYPLDGFEYAIGSVHYVQSEAGYHMFDTSLERTLDIINTYFAGDAMHFAKAYFEAVANLPACGRFDIVGHFDLLTKNNEKGGFLDTACGEYKRLALEAIDALAGKIPAIEVNTGAIARGYRTSPYPALDLLREMRNRGFLAVISSDCHDKRFLDCHFGEAKELLRAAGYTARAVLTEKGFAEVAL